MADRYDDAEPDEAVTVTGVGPATLGRAVRKREDWREHHGLASLIVYRDAGEELATLDAADLGLSTELERFR